MLRHPIMVGFFCLSAQLTAASGAEQRTAAREPVLLEQGWTADERLQFYYTTQGSQLIPYDWFLALEQADSEELFRTDANLERLRFLPHPADPQRNPDGLPIGFVKDDNPRTMEYIIKKSFLGADYDRQQYPITNAWLGLTCAACHTTELHHAGQAVRIDGGPALADVEQFLQQLAAAVEATCNDPEKMTRFAKRALQDTGYNAIEARALQQRVEAYSDVLRQTVRRGEGSTPYGFGRLDAFGAILNEICETALELPENHYPADAPASFPFLWNTSQLDWVQWNGSAGNPIARNVGEVLGVFAQFRLLPEPAEAQFRSTAHIVNLFELEQHVAKLKAPAWPAEFGTLDRKKAAQGQRLFAQNCASCHGVPDPANGEYPTRTIAGRPYIKTRMVPLVEIGTDPKLAVNFASRQAKPGALARLLPPPLVGAERVPRFVLLSLAVQGVIRKYVRDEHLTAEHIAELSGYRPANEQPPNLLAYKARPLNGVWATAPYLHNGSVPNLYELLLPTQQRSETFFVGSREFDTRRVGFVTEQTPGSFTFSVSGNDRPIPGNLNSGHEGHGADPSEGFTETFENGAWREFTDEERWALVEYMKCIGDPAAIDPGDAGDEQTVECEPIPCASAPIRCITESPMGRLKNRWSGQSKCCGACAARMNPMIQLTGRANRARVIAGWRAGSWAPRGYRSSRRTGPSRRTFGW